MHQVGAPGGGRRHLTHGRHITVGPALTGLVTFVARVRSLVIVHPQL
ncbi:MAG: hypothetical protein IPQ14_10270 [Candidatus Microthrix sp.]|nr:hypothetical protein [Candidatus Microthrix sp.]MBL0204688.1 hypothetical protein [Candidatus Microthrix sp.]